MQLSPSENSDAVPPVDARRKITPEEREHWTGKFNALQANLSQWLTPSDFNSRVAELVGPEGAPGHVLFNLPAAVIGRDAWTLGTFAALAGADQVRLSGDQWPDGLVRFRERVVNIEATEVDEEGRRRGEEYRLPEAMRFDPVEDWVQRAEAVGPQLAAAIEAKNAKHYSSACELVVYVNLSEYGVRRPQVEATIRDCQSRLRGRFDAVHVIWDDRLFAAPMQTS